MEISGVALEATVSGRASTSRGRLAGLAATVAGMGLVLLASGAAGLINEVVWQRSLKRFLGGSETTCSMVVVLVFMAGLGCGSLWMGNRANRVKDPLRALALVELLLGLVTLGIRFLLDQDLSQSIFRFQALASAMGVPLAALYALGALVVLLVPCLLMGATLPLASETCQRRLGLTDGRVLGLLFFINTFGAMAGCVLAGTRLIPELGLSASLSLAAGLNGLAALLAGAFSILVRPAGSVAPAAESLVSASGVVRSFWRPAPAEILALGLGFCSLGYEMALLRVVPLRDLPLPFTFAAVLSGFLLFWSLGAGLSSWLTGLSIGRATVLCALAILACVPGYWYFDQPVELTGVWSFAEFLLKRAWYFVPCLLFGYLFSRLACHAARAWGRDVGRIYAWNTAGSCLGILGMTFVGYEMHAILMPVLLACLLLALGAYWVEKESGATAARSVPLPRWMYALAGAALTVAASWTMDLSAVNPSMSLFFGRDGVVGVDERGNMFWDGLWHSQLSRNRDHIGTNNWRMAVAPVLSHPTGEIRDVCVIGLGTGITSSTLAQLKGVERVDTYEINRTLLEVYRRYPEGMLGALENPKIRVIWQDGRSGLALRPDQYDLITTQPLYLKQAGSALLNSVEFYRLVSQRLKPGGVFCLYSNGTVPQARVLRQTAAQVFPHGETYFNGYLLVLSNAPLALSAEVLLRRLEAHPGDPLWDELRAYDAKGKESIRSFLDSPRLDWKADGWTVTDDRPWIEYPFFLARQFSTP